MSNRLEEIKSRLVKATQGKWRKFRFAGFMSVQAETDDEFVDIACFDSSDFMADNMECNADFVANSSDDIRYLLTRLEEAEAALRYCSDDDSMAVDPGNRFDVDSANEWKKMRARAYFAKHKERS